MNGVAASMLLALTASVRFEGILNTDLNDITMNLVPFPRMHFLLSALAPLAAAKDVGRAAAPRALDQLFRDVFSREHQLLAADPRQGTCLAAALLLRGSNVAMGDVTLNVARLRQQLRMPHWNSEGFKIGLCSVPPVGLPHSLLCLSNSCTMAATLTTLRQRFDKLYGRRLFLHHYEEYMERAGFDEAAEVVSSLAEEYRAADAAALAPPPPVQLSRPCGLTFL